MADTTNCRFNELRCPDVAALRIKPGVSLGKRYAFVGWCFSKSSTTQENKESLHWMTSPTSETKTDASIDHVSTMIWGALNNEGKDPPDTECMIIWSPSCGPKTMPSAKTCHLALRGETTSQGGAPLGDTPFLGDMPRWPAT